MEDTNGHSIFLTAIGIESGYESLGSHPSATINTESKAVRKYLSLFLQSVKWNQDKN